MLSYHPEMHGTKWDGKTIATSDSAIVDLLDGDALIIRDDDLKFNEDGTLKNGRRSWYCGTMVCL